MVNPYESYVIDENKGAGEEDLHVVTTTKVCILVYWVHQGAKIRMQVAQGYRGTGKEG